MLTLYITSIDRQNERRTFTCYLNEFETALATLSLIAASGNTLVEVYIIEAGKRTNLSPQAFDGQDILSPIQGLQRQWEDLLNQPWEKPNSAADHSLIEMTLQRIDQFETIMAVYDSSIKRLEQLLSKTQLRLKEGFQKDQLLSHYQIIINQQHSSMIRAQAGRDEWLNKLTQLKCS